MDKMKDRIVGYLELHTNKNDVFIEIVKLTEEIFESNTIGELNDFNNGLNELRTERTVRLHQKNNQILVGLEANVEKNLNIIKKDAIKEMETEMENCVKVEDYEGAAEWKKMIDESLNK